jgi:hypothetical protein
MNGSQMAMLETFSWSCQWFLDITKAAKRGKQREERRESKRDRT